MAQLFVTLATTTSVTELIEVVMPLIILKWSQFIHPDHMLLYQEK